MLHSGVLGAPHGWSPPEQVVYDVTIAYDPPALPRALFKEFFQGTTLGRCGTALGRCGTALGRCGTALGRCGTALPRAGTGPLRYGTGPLR
jgi:hypothetical protein